MTSSPRASLRTPLAALLCLGLATSCDPPEQKEVPDLIILQTGRLRGNVFPRDADVQHGLPYYAHIGGHVRAVRAEAARIGADVLLIDLGDSLGGSFTSHVTDSANMVTFFNELDYDAIALGNLDAAVSPEVIASLDMPVLIPFTNARGEPALDGAVLGARLDLPGGLTAALLPNFLGDMPVAEDPGKFPSSFGGVPEVFPVRDLSNLAARLDGWDESAIRLLTLMKFDPNSAPMRAFIDRMAADNVDCVLAHRIYGGDQGEAWKREALDDYPIPVNMNILRRNAGFTVARIDLKKSPDGWRMLRRDITPMSSNTATADRELTDTINRLYASRVREANRLLGDLKSEISKDHLLDEVMSLLANLSPDRAALYSPDSIRTPLPAGPLSLSLLHDSIPWLDPVVLLTLTPADIKRIQASDTLDIRLPTDTPPDGPVEVATSAFFADLLDAQSPTPLPSRPTARSQPVFLLLADVIEARNGLSTPEQRGMD